MAYNFYVLEGKKLIDYKPKSEHYKRAIIRMIQDDFSVWNIVTYGVTSFK